MREFDSLALQELGRVLGISSPIPQRIEFQDELLQLVLEASPFVRRARTGTRPGFGGFAHVILSTTHAAADTQTASVTPYTLANPSNGWPAVVPASLDVWCLAWSAVRTGGAGDITFSDLFLSVPASFAANSGGAAQNIVIQRWGAVIATPSAGPFWLTVNDGRIGLRGRPFRVPAGPNRSVDGSTITFRTVANAAGDFQCTLLLGLFPAGLGQDAWL